MQLLATSGVVSMPTFERRRMHLGACHELGRANCSTDAAGAVQIEQPRGFGRYLTHWLLLGSEDRLASCQERRRTQRILQTDAKSRG